MIKPSTMLAATLLCVPQVLAETRQMNLLNPDGTPAVDAKAIAVLTTPGAMVDHELKPLPFHTMDGQRHASPIKRVVNEGGTISFDVSAKAIVAQNDNGFVFVPAVAFSDSAKLRPWHHIDLKTSTIPDEQRDLHRLRIMWHNHLVGSTPLSMIGMTSAAQPDWRLDPMVSVSQFVELKNAKLRVPPGEWQLSIVDAAQVKRVENDEVDFKKMAGFMQLGVWAAAGEDSTEIVLPDFGSIQGDFSPLNDLPDWGQRNSGDTEFVVLQKLSEDVPTLDHRWMLSTANGFRSDRGLPVVERKALSKYLSALASPTGVAFRNSNLSRSAGHAVLDENEKFQFKLVPVGEYCLLKKVQEAREIRPHRFGQKPPPSWMIYTAEAVYQAGKPRLALMRVNVEAGATTELGKVESGTIGKYAQQGQVQTQSAAAAAGRGQRQFGNSTVVRETRKTESRQRHAEGPADAMLQQWLKVHEKDGDKQQLREDLRQHLQNEFTANQRSREAEIERLQQLINKSKQWLGQREKNRDNIIRKRVEDLLSKAEN